MPEKYKIKYVTADGEIVAMGAYGPDFVASAGETVEDFTGDIPRNIKTYTRTDPNTLTLKSASEVAKIEACRKFHTLSMIKRFGEVFTGTAGVDLAPYLSAIKSYTGAKNFAGLKVFMADVVTDGKMTAQQQTDLKNVLLEQNLDLDDY